MIKTEVYPQKVKTSPSSPSEFIYWHFFFYLRYDGKFFENSGIGMDAIFPRCLSNERQPKLFKHFMIVSKAMRVNRSLFALRLLPPPSPDNIYTNHYGIMLRIDVSSFLTWISVKHLTHEKQPFRNFQTGPVRIDNKLEIRERTMEEGAFHRT